MWDCFICRRFSRGESWPQAPQAADVDLKILILLPVPGKSRIRHVPLYSAQLLPFVKLALRSFFIAIYVESLLYKNYSKFYIKRISRRGGKVEGVIHEIL